MERTFDCVKERKEITDNFKMGFLTYQEYVTQMAETMGYKDRKIILSEIQKLMDSDYMDNLRREVQSKVDDMLFQNDAINDILNNI